MVEIKNKTQARQGERGKSVLWVLIGSMVLLVIATAALLTWNGANSPKDYASQSQDASRKEITGSAGGGSNAPGSAASGGVPAGNPSYPQPAQPTANGNAK